MNAKMNTKMNTKKYKETNCENGMKNDMKKRLATTCRAIYTSSRLSCHLVLANPTTVENSQIKPKRKGKRKWH